MAHTRPTYDFLTGTEGSPPHHAPATALKQSVATRADINNENLRAQLNTLQYELDSIRQERELTQLRHQEELRDALTRSEADFTRAQAAQSAGSAATKRAEELAREHQDVVQRAANDSAALERKVRGLQEESRGLREELEDAQAELASHDRRHKHAYEELEQRHVVLQASVQGIEEDLESKISTLETTKHRLARKEAQAGELESEVLRLKAQTGDVDTLAIVKKELTEQVTYIRKLEAASRDHLAELKQYRKMQRNIEVVEEEKRALEAKARMMDDLRKELAEAQLQKRILEDEKQSWSSYLECEAAGEDDMKYDTPEQMARAFLHERLERLTLIDKLGSVQPELVVKDENIRTLEDDKARLHAELEQLRQAGVTTTTSSSGDGKARMRLERQKNLVMKEVEYLRAQLKTMEAEEAEFTPEQVDQQRVGRVHELEDMIEQYRTEVETLQSELSKLQTQYAVQSPKKRSREEDQESTELLGELRRKARALQYDLNKLQTRNQLLEGDLKASVSHIAALKESTRTRVLELRNNPTAVVEAMKMSTLQTLRDENAALLAQLEGKPLASKVVPISTLENARLQLTELKVQMAQTDKKTLRLKQIWSSKSLEFREAVCSLLGWKLDFLPNGRVKATSILYPSQLINGEEEENSIVFDGENGTMKVSGGPASVFAGEIRGLIEYWVEGKKEVACLLAALTLEFYERRTQ